MYRIKIMIKLNTFQPSSTVGDDNLTITNNKSLFAKFGETDDRHIHVFFNANVISGYMGFFNFPPGTLNGIDLRQYQCLLYWTKSYI